MNVKRLIAATVAGLFLVPALATAYTYDPADYGKKTETLVEGHTVFAVIQASMCIDYTDNESTVKCPGGSGNDFDVSYDVRVNTTVQRLGTAVAVLVRDRVKPYNPGSATATCESNRDLVTTIFYENPGVLWFNDQFLVGDDLDILETEVDANVDVCMKKASIRTDVEDTWRYPCGGWVLATQHGMPDPRGSSIFPLWSYQESYRIEDPNGYVWVVDKFHLGNGTLTGVNVPGFDEMRDFGHNETGAPPVFQEGLTTTGDEDGDDGVYDGDEAADGDVRAVLAAQTPAGAVSYYLGSYNMWSVPVLGRDTADGGPTGTGCEAYADTATYDAGGGDSRAGVPYTYGDGDYDTASDECRDSRNENYVPNGTGPDCPDASAYQPEQDAVNGGENVRLYNAVLFFFFEDLLDAHETDGAVGLVPTGSSLGFKVHGEGAQDDTDTTGCEEGTEWTCGDNDDWGDPDGSDMNGYQREGFSDDGYNDDDEGNSHPFNPYDNTSGATHVHPTTKVDLYFHNVRPPSPDDADRRYTIYDTVGSNAPGMGVRDPDGLSPWHMHQGAGTFDDRVSYDACADADVLYEESDRVYNGGGTYTGTTYGRNDQVASAEADGDGAEAEPDPDDVATGGADAPGEDNGPGGTEADATPYPQNPSGYPRDDEYGVEGTAEYNPPASTGDCTGYYDGGSTGYYDPAYSQYGGEYY